MTTAPETTEQKPDLVTVTIDGFEISVPKGTLIIRAAEQLGISIPRFCDHPLLDPVGACRQCLVEVPDMGNGRGMPKPPASCTTTVMPGMVIKTQVTSAVAERAQRGNMELLLINHPLDCPICDKGGECPLQNQAMSSGAPESRFLDRKRTFPKPIAISSQVLLDRERCVQCARCTRFSDQVAGDAFIDLFERSANEQVAIAEGHPFQSYFSGNTVQICPVGALTGASYRFRSRPFDLVSTPSICEHCAAGCAQRTDWRRGKVLRRLAGNDPEVNEEWNCDKGRWAFAYTEQRDRILTPQVRAEDGELHEASWPEALERAAAGLRQAREHGGVGVLPGGRLTYEDAYSYAKFARTVLGTNDIDARARPHSPEEQRFLAERVAGVREDAGVTYADLGAAPTVLLAGLEPEEESPILFLRLRKAVRRTRLAVFSIAPFATRGLTKLDGILIPTRPGAERLALATAPENVTEALRAPGAVILVGERLAEIPDALTAAAALADRTGAKLAWIPRRAGERGAIDAGALPGLLPGARIVADAASRDEVAAVWGTAVPETAGRDLTGMLRAAVHGELAGLLVGGVDTGDLPDPELAERALEAAGFVVSLELRRSPVTARADVVLPVAPTTQKAGSFIDWEGRVRHFDETFQASGALGDGRVLHALAEELNVFLGLPTPSAAAAELDRLGIARRATRDDSAGRSGSPAAHSATSAAGPATPGAADAVLATWSYALDAGRMQDGEEHLAGTAKAAGAVLSPATAAGLGVVDGAVVTVASEHGEISVLAQVVASMVDGAVFVPTNSLGANPGTAVRRNLRVGNGAPVRLRAMSGPAGGTA